MSACTYLIAVRKHGEDGGQFQHAREGCAAVSFTIDTALCPPTITYSPKTADPMQARSRTH
jgi:hypothetical protein